MNKTSGTSKAAADKLVKAITHKTRKFYSAEERSGIVLAGLRGEEILPRCAAGKGKDLRAESAALNEVVADLTLQNRLLIKA